MEKGYILNIRECNIIAGWMKLDNRGIFRHDHQYIDGAYIHRAYNDIFLYGLWRKRGNLIVLSKETRNQCFSSNLSIPV